MSIGGRSTACVSPLRPRAARPSAGAAGPPKPDHPSQGPRPSHHASSFLTTGRPEIVTGLMSIPGIPAPEPQADVLWRHRRRHCGDQIGFDALQVDLVAQLVGKRIDVPRRR